MNVMDGKGEIDYEDGRYFQGHFRNGHKHGPGTMK